MSLQDVDIDLTGYSGKKDFQVIGSYIDINRYTITVIRLDCVNNEGWNEKLTVLVNFKKHKRPFHINIGPSSSSRKVIEVGTDINLGLPGETIKECEQYRLLAPPVFQHISRENFNKKFKSEVVTLPLNLFAVGVKDELVYLYNETFEMLYMIELTIANIVNTLIEQKIYKKCHFVICATDGYMERHYPTTRNVPIQIGENDALNKKEVIMEESNTYPVFYDNKYIFAQNNQKGVENTINVPDRYYFYMNRYNEYRSIHAGIPFEDKKNTIVYGSQKRGTQYNFTENRHIKISPRDYFYSDAIKKTNIFVPKWISRSEMVKYKYILDIDGHASTWDATAWKLNSGSVIIKSDSCWNQWFFEYYRPWVHYVPIRDDFSDIQEKYTWCEQNQAKCVEMIENCKRLFQVAYRFNSVVKYIKDSLFKMHNLKPYTIGNRRLFVLTNGPKLNDENIYMTVLNNPDKLTAIKHLCEILNNTDTILYVNAHLTDINYFQPAGFLEAYDSINRKIVYGAEKNLWPESANEIGVQLRKLVPEENQFKYLNAGFFCAEVGEMGKMLDEQIYEKNIAEQEYLMRVYVTNRYSMSLDYNQKLVLNTFKCTGDEIAKYKSKGTPFIHFNAGR
jgi:hypothetical protein